MTDAPKAPAAEKGTTTRYVILTFDTTTDNWFEAGDRVPATSKNAAIAKHSRAYAEGSATYVAIPERSWKPIKVTVSTETVVKLGDA